MDSEHIGKLNQMSFTKSQNLEVQTFSIGELGKINPTPQKSCFPQLQMVETARSLISKLVEEKLQRERKTSKILKKSRKKNDNSGSIERVEQMPQNKVGEMNPVISIAKINVIVLSFPTESQ